MGVLVALALGHCYQLKYTDCSQPVKIKRFDAAEMCKKQESEKTETFKYTILQAAGTRTVKGYHCLVRASTFHFFCGAFSHMKSIRAPQISETVALTPAGCRDMVEKQEFVPPTGGGGFHLKIGSENRVAVNEKGAVEVRDDNVQCRGQEVKVDNQLLSGVVILTEYRVTLREQTFLIKGEEVEVQSPHLKLRCKNKSGGCLTGEGTYYWDPPQECALEKVQDINAQVTLGTYLYDQQKKILINVTGEESTPPGCEEGKLKTTNYDGIYLADQVMASKLPSLEATAFKLDIELKSKSDLIVYELEQQILRGKVDLFGEVCSREVSKLGAVPTKMRDGRFGWIRAGLLYTFECSERISDIAELDKCYTAVPVTGTEGKTIFVDPITKVRVGHAAEIPCDRRFPLTVSSTTSWVSINPHVAVAAPPDSPPRLAGGEVTHLQVSEGGLYTDEEQKAFEDLIAFPTYQEALLTGLTMGVCKDRGECFSSTDLSNAEIYQLGRLIPEATTSIKDQFWSIIREYGDLASCAVLVIVGLYLISCIVMLVWTLITEGPAASIALLITLVCGSVREYRRIGRRRQRERDRGPDQQVTWPLTFPLRPLQLQDTQ